MNTCFVSETSEDQLQFAEILINRAELHAANEELSDAVDKGEKVGIHACCIEHRLPGLTLHSLKGKRDLV